ncbi:MAG: delta-aminolevulinic acid dehydratase [Epulopiscium sp. Nuni2H_MBin003]|nr:MAG: delta-aminolevulinic acid dehydratase [Epulopiscium sp. Nuni2H_MBin003]
MKPRRLRNTPTLRKMVRETRLDKSALIYPIFVIEGDNIKEEILSMPGQFRYSVDRLNEVLTETLASGVLAVIFFGIPKEKDEIGSGAYAQDGIVQQALRYTKRNFPAIYCITDICMCEYTSHGHCGILEGKEVQNNATVEVLANIAISHAQAGADMVAPSDMMDGRVKAIRKKLDDNGYINTPIMSYSAKYASAFYGPFREAAGSAPSFGDRKSYQMDYHNTDEAMKEVLLDVEEGADIIMIKPALSYLDIISNISKVINLPICAYSVSGEYAMVKATAAAGFVDEDGIICEMAVSAFRAGVSMYITYFAKEIARFIDEGRIG